MYVESDNLRPTRAHNSDAGLDLRAKEEYILRPGHITKVYTGVYMNMGGMENWVKVGLIFPRSSLGKKGICLANTIGVIDQDYRGEIILLMHNNSTVAYKVEKYERVAQLLILDCDTAEPIFVASKKDLGDTERGEGGFGSSGKH